MANIIPPTPTSTQDDLARRLRWPAWRLPNSVKMVSDEELEASVESCENWAVAFACMLLVGILGEIVSLLLPATLSHSAAVGWPIGANVLVFIGVAGEVRFGRMAGRRQSELVRRSKEKLAEAIDRATSAQTALERYKAPRQISSSQKVEIIAAIRQFAGTQINLWANPDLPESQNLLIALGAALEAAGWMVTQTRIVGGYTSSAGGVLITCTTRPDAVAAGQALAKALGNVGLFSSCAPILGEGPPDAPPRLFAVVQPKPLEDVEKIITEARKNMAVT